MAVSQDEEAEDRYAKEKMAAVAGAPASGEGGGEAEADSEAIPGAERPGEAAVGAGCVQGRPGSEEVSSPWVEGLRQPQAEEGTGPEGAEASAWPSGHNMDTRDCNMAEPMQLAEGLICPPGPASLGPTFMEVCDMSSSMLDIPNDAEAQELYMEETGSLSSPKSLSLQPMMEERDDQSLWHNQTPIKATEPISMEGIEVIPAYPTPDPEEQRLSQSSPDQEEPRNPSSKPKLEPTGHTPSPQETRLSPSPEHIRLSPSNPICVRDGSGLAPPESNYELEESVPSLPGAEKLALSQPNPNLQELVPSQPNAEALAPSQPNPDLEELASSQTNPDLEELPPSETNPDVEELLLSEPNPNVEEPALSDAYPDLEELPLLDPNPGVEEPALSEANLDLEDLSPSEPIPDLKALAAFECNPDLEELPPSEPSPALKELAQFECNPDLEEQSPSEPNPDLEELPISEPKLIVEESAPSEPTPGLEELAPSEPTLGLEELAPSEPTLGLEELAPSEPTLGLEELAPSEPTLGLEELAPSEPTLGLEELAPSEPTLGLEELAPSEPTLGLEELAPSEPTLGLEELAPSEPTLGLEELAPSEPTLGLEELAPSEPTLGLEELAPSEPTLGLEELAPSEPTLGLEELAPSEPTLGLEELAPSEPTPGLEELAPSEPTPGLEELAPSEPTPGLEELAPSEPTPGLEELAPSEPTPGLEELAPSEPTPGLEELAPSEPTPGLEELPPSEPTPDLEELPPSEPTPDLEELPPSEPTPDLEELPPSEPTPDLEELPPSGPTPDLEELPPSGPTPDLEELPPSGPTPDLVELPPSGPTPDLEELPPSEPTPDLEELPPSEPTPDLEELPPSEPTPDLEELPPSEPTPDLEELPPSEPTPDLEELPPSEPTPDLEELPPSEPTPDLEELPTLDLEELPPLEPTRDLEDLPTPDLEELPPSEPTPDVQELPPSEPTPDVQELPPSEPTPDLNQLSHSEVNPDLMKLVPSMCNPVLEDLVPTEPSSELQVLAPSEPTPDLEELAPSEPTPDLEELAPSEPTPDLEELAPSEPTPDLEELAPSEPTPDLEELAPSEPNPDLEELAPSEPTPDLEELAPSEPTPDLEELAPSEPNPDLEELAPSEPNPDLEELAPSEPTPDLEELAPSEPNPDLEELAPSEPNPDLEELAPSEPNPDLEELAPVEYNSDMQGPAQSVYNPDLEKLTPSEPNLDQENLAPPEPNPDLEKLPPSEPNLEMEEPALLEPNPHLLELSLSEPNPDLLALSPSEPNPDLVKLPPSEPNPDLVKLPPSEPNPDLVKLSPSEPNLDLVKLPPSEPSLDFVELITPVPNPGLVESTPLEYNPDVEVLETCLWSNSAPRIEGLASTLQDSIPRKVLEVMADHQELRPPSSHSLPLPKQCPPETVLEEAQGMCTVECVDHLSGNLTQQSKAEFLPFEEQGMNNSVKDTCSKLVSVVQEVFITQAPISEVHSKHREAVLFPKGTCRTEEPIEEMDVELAPQVVSLLENSNHHETHLVPKMDFQASGQLLVESEHDVIMMEEACLKHADPEFDESKVVDSGPNSLHKSRNEIHDLIKAKVDHVPELLPSKLQQGLDAVTVEEKVLALGVAEINQEVHPITGQCAELGVEVKLFLQPVLNKCSEGTDCGHLNAFPLVSQNTAFIPEDPSKELVSEVTTVLEAGSIQTFRNNSLEVPSETVCSNVSELGSKFVCSEPRRENSPECKESTSLPGDKDYDPFYRDFNNERIYVDKRDMNSDNRLGPHQAPKLIPDAPQFKDHNEFHLEEPKPSSVDSGVEMCSDNPDRCEGPLALERRGDPGGIADLALGSEVQVKLDHIIQDALVVSFRHGDRIFSGVLMDLSKRFGPHGIPVTLHPKREYKSVSQEPIQVQSTSFQEVQKSETTTDENGTAPADVPPIQSNEPCGGHNLWTSKPPPLFHEGAPYPPPLFIRDTYNQSIPQPPPRKIKRLKKKIYREEPTSIMNAIKLRPRQVLCDKCKNVVADKKEVRKTGPDSFKLEEGKRRRHDSVTTVNKKLKTEHKVNGKSQNESQKRNPVSKVPNIGHGRGKVVKVAPQTSTQKAQLHAKKVLQSKNMDHVKAREVLKMAKEKAQKKQKETSSSKSAHNKVHFTRRLQTTSSGTLPPRLRIKPQRYRNEENDSSLKIGLESLRSNKMGIKPQTRHTATRSAGEAPSEITSPSNGPQEASSDIPNPSVCVPPGEQDESQALGKRGGKSNITVYMTLNQKKADSSSASVCSSDSTDDLKSTHSECSSTENFDFPPGSMHAPSSSSSSSSKEEKKLSNSLKLKMFSKNVSKCVTPDGRTICVGDIVWAKIYGFPWWPARILAITVSRKDNGLLARQEARISWFGSPTTSFLALSQLSPFLENFQSRFNKKRKGLYRKAITEAAKAAKQLTPEVRALLTQFET